MFVYEIQHLLLDFGPRAAAILVAKNLIGAATAVKMNGGDPSDLELRRDVIPKGVLDPLVVRYYNVREDDRRPLEFRTPMKRFELLFQHSTSRTNRAGKFHEDKLVGIGGLEVSAERRFFGSIYI